jgi:hypothetical protein
MGILPLIYGAVVITVLGSGIGVYLVFSRRSKVIGFAAGLTASLALVLLWPIPIHGGFTFLGDELYTEITNWLQETRLRREAFIGDREEAPRKPHYGGPLDIAVVQELSPEWFFILVNGKVPAWHHATTGLLWSEWLALAPTEGHPELGEAKARCQHHAPPGRWELASELDNYLLWRTDGDRFLPAAPASSMSYLSEETLAMELPTYDLRRPAGSQGQAPFPSRSRRFFVRCITGAPGVPLARLSRQQIPLDDWNRYQLSKNTPKAGAPPGGERTGAQPR